MALACGCEPGTQGGLTANKRYWQEMRFGNLLVMCQVGTLPADLTRKNLELFAREVMPALKLLQ